MPKKPVRNPKLAQSRKAVGFPSTAITQYQRNQIAAAGLDPSIVPEPAFRFVRPAEASMLLGVSLATLYRCIADGSLPRPIDISRTLSKAA